MREAARIASGYFPLPDSAIDCLCERLGGVRSDSIHIFDPCAGNGGATARIASAMGLPASNVWPIELDRDRGAEVKEKFPNTISPGDLFSCSVSNESFSVIYVNSPYGDDGSGGRIETAWMRKTVGKLVPHGVFIQILPHYVGELTKYREAVAPYLHHFTLLKLPGVKHQEAAMIALRRPQSLAPGRAPRWAEMEAMKGYRYFAPKAPGPKVWAKAGLTDEELVERMESSPIMRHISVPPVTEVPNPPLALNRGHIALLLATGMLDGVIRPTDGTSPHVIRGVARKGEEINDEETELSKNGKSVTRKFTVTERISICLRCLTDDGSIHTLQ